MAVPTYQSRESVTTEVPAAPVSPEKAATLGGEVTDLGEGLSSLGEHFMKIQAQQESDGALDRLSKASGKINADTLSDPDVHGAMDKADKSYEQLKSNQLGTIKSAAGKEKFLHQANVFINNHRTHLATNVMQRQVSLAKAQYTASVDTLADSYNTASPDQLDLIKQQIKDKAEDYKSLDVLHPGSASAHLKATIDKLGVSRLKTQLASAESLNDPVEQVKYIQNELKNGDKGEYKDIPPEKREQALGEVQKVMARAEKVSPMRQRLINHIYDKHVTKKYADGSLTENDLIHSQNHMSEERFNLLSKNLLLDRTTYEPKPEEYAKAIEFVSDTDKHTERDCMNYIIQAENSKNLTKDEAHNLVKMFMVDPSDDPNLKLPKRPGLNDMTLAQEEKDKLSEKKREPNKWSWKMLMDHFGGDKNKAATLAKEVHENSVKDTSKKTDLLQDTTNVIKKDNLKKFPHAAMGPKLGITLMDAKGNRARILPDGSLYEE